MDSVSLYLHLPFCQHRCGYCDFNTYAGIDHLIPSYVDAMVKEINLFAENARGHVDLPVCSVYFGGGTPSIAELAEEEIVRKARAELKEMLGIAAQPVHAEVFRWINMAPRTEVGHLELVELIVGQLPAGLFLAESSNHGMTVSDCIRQGYDTAEFCLQFIGKM